MALVDLDTPDQLLLEGGLVGVDRVAVDVQQRCRLARLDVDAEAPDYFFDPVAT